MAFVYKCVCCDQFNALELSRHLNRYGLKKTSVTIRYFKVYIRYHCVQKADNVGINTKAKPSKFSSRD